ncbi:SnoaL-like domain protein [Streptomyces sp. YIM 121038]|uniref:nuclear transport factor 2 family protein n=1 Tax=Streptomyces sp. YIM 121038 TaxID=2136401 RepID=UPI0011648681|nr:nuclear transport factor 2 family protein [Streptomyces sp. YIM 121038]QCX80379.1 SnoaL-like domain protein [Streptomyces sp. YIM 121038]
MSTHSPEASARATREVIDAYLARLADRDLDGAVRLFAESAEFLAPGSPAVPWSGHHTGHKGVAHFFATLHEYLQPEEFTVTHIVVDGEHGVIIGHLRDTVKATGKPLTTPFAAHLTVVDGRVARYHLFEDTHALHRAVTDG